jgi:predicted nucleic acid-binding protein
VLAPFGLEEVALPMIVFAELLVGAELADSPRRARQRRELRVEVLRPPEG